MNSASPSWRAANATRPTVTTDGAGSCSVAVPAGCSWAALTRSTIWPRSRPAEVQFGRARPYQSVRAMRAVRSRAASARRSGHLGERLRDQAHALLDRGLGQVAVAEQDARYAAVREAMPGQALHADAVRSRRRQQRGLVRGVGELDQLEQARRSPAGPSLRQPSLERRQEHVAA